MNPVICCNGKHIVITSLASDCWLYSLTDADQNPQQLLAERQVDKKSNVDAEAKGTVLATAFSTSGRYFAATDDFKHTYLFSTANQTSSWKILSTRSMPKKGVKIAFVKDDSCFVVADKFGDVQQFSVTSPEATGTIILGHLSMLLDITFLRNDEFIATCDRDEKLRVSRYPNTYNIQSFCLGHTKYVSSIIEIDQMLVSGSGDGSIILWNPLTGEKLCQYVFKDENRYIVKFMTTIESQHKLICAFDDVSKLTCLSVSNKDGSWYFHKEEDIEVSGVPLGLCAAKDTLLVLQDSVEEPLKVISLSGDCSYPEQAILKINEELKTNWVSFRGAAQFQNLFFDNLEKMAADNIDEYIKKRKTDKRHATNDDPKNMESDCAPLKMKPSTVKDQ